MSNEINVNQNTVVFPSAQRTATITSASIDNPTAKGIVIFLNVTQASGTGGIQVNLLNVDPASGNAVSFLGPEPRVTGMGLSAYTYYPGFTTGAGGGNSGVVTRTFQIQVIHNDSSNYTYSVGISLVR